MESKRGLSPVIATILLILLVFVIAFIIILWARGFVSEVIEKQGKSGEQACSEINLQASVASGSLQLVNRGNIAVYQIELLKKSGGRTDRDRIAVDLGPGQAKPDITISGSYDDYEIVPVILGTSNDQKKAYTCPNKKISVEL